MNNLSVTLFCTLLIVFCASIFAQFDVPGGFEMAMKEGYNQYTLSDDQRRNIGQQIMDMRNENRDNSLSGDQTTQYAQIMSRMGQDQQTMENDDDQEMQYADIQTQGMNNKPQDEYVDGNNQIGVTEAIDPLTLREDNQVQSAQYGVTEAIDPRSLPQSNVEQDQTENYAHIEQEKYAKQERIARKNEERSRNEVPIAVQAIDPQEILAFQQTGENQGQLTSGFDQTEYFSNVMRGKAAAQDQLANEQAVTSGLGVFQAIDPQNLSQQQQQASPSGTKSWASLNAKSFYVPQSSGRRESSSSYDFRSLDSANNADQTSDYLRIMAQQRRIQQQLQS